MLKNKNKNKREIYIKSYLNRNLGDDLFLEILSKRYKTRNFIAMSAIKYENNYKNIKIVNNRKLDKLIRRVTFNARTYENILMAKCDFTILIGGSMFMENEYYKKNRRYINKNKRYYILGTNFGPYYTQEYYNKFYKLFSKAEDVCFREEYSYNLFKDLTNIRVAPDIVFSLDTSDIKITNNKKVIISVVDSNFKTEVQYKDSYENKIIELINFFDKKGYEIVLMSYCKEEGDEDAINCILNKIDDEALKGRINVYLYDGNVEEALNVMGDCQIVVGSRFHANILGLILNKTIIPIVYSDKTLNVLNDIKFKGKIFDIRELEKCNINSLTEEDLIYKLDVSFQKGYAQKQFEKLDKEIY